MSGTKSESPLELEQLAITAYLSGRDAESLDLLQGAYDAFLAAGQTQRAARSACWLTFVLLNISEPARAAGWGSRAERLLDQCGGDCVERGYLRLFAALQRAAARDAANALAVFTEAAGIGDRFGERDLISLARQGCGRSLIALGHNERGFALLDEVMLAVIAGEVSPIVAGTVYCSVIAACFEQMDLKRAREWTEALNRWCQVQPDRVPYRGPCLVYRAEVLRLHGAWPDAVAEARRACQVLAEASPPSAAGAAFYQLAELLRLRGEFAEADAAYRQAATCGRSPHPGLALLRLAQGQPDAALAAIARVAAEAPDDRARARVLPAFVEILVATTDVARADEKAHELAGIASRFGTPVALAVSAQATGAVRLAAGDPKGALPLLREAQAAWRDLAMPYDTARVSELIGLACRQLGDADSGQIDLDDAARVFNTLGARPDFERVQAARGPRPPAAPGGLTSREVQVIKLIATGMTNRAIAETLAISEKTVARHVSNIFTKLDLSTRAAAAAYAFQHHLA